MQLVIPTNIISATVDAQPATETAPVHVESVPSSADLLDVDFEGILLQVAPIPLELVPRAIADESAGNSVNRSAIPADLTTALTGSSSATVLAAPESGSEAIQQIQQLETGTASALTSELADTTATLSDTREISTPQPVIVEAELQSASIAKQEADAPERSRPIDVSPSTSAEASLVIDEAKSPRQHRENAGHQIDSQQASSQTPEIENLVSLSSNSLPTGGVSTTRVDAQPLDVALQIAAEATHHAELIRHQGNARFTMRLDPPELGAVTVEMQQTETGITLHVTAAEAATLALIQETVQDINGELMQRESVFHEVNIDVTTGQGSNHESDNHSEANAHQKQVSGSEKPRATRQISFVA